MSIHTQPLAQQPPRDPDLANAEIALKRAAVNAYEQAKKNGTAIVILENGVIREIVAEPTQNE